MTTSTSHHQSGRLPSRRRRDAGRCALSRLELDSPFVTPPLAVVNGPVSKSTPSDPLPAEKDKAELKAAMREERATQFTLARYSALAGLGGTFAGAFIGITGTYVVTDRQIDAQADQAQHSFIRDERRNAYTAMLGASNEAVEFELNVSFELTTNVADLDPDVLPGYIRTARALISKIHGANSVVMMTGSTDPVNASDLLKSAHTRYLKNLIISMEEFPFDDVEADLRRVRGRLEKDGSAVAETSAQYLQAIRAGLNVDEAG